jgi:hypothetical protein
MKVSLNSPKVESHIYIINCFASHDILVMFHGGLFWSSLLEWWIKIFWNNNLVYQNGKNVNWKIEPFAISLGFFVELIKTPLKKKIQFVEFEFS